MDVGTLGKYRIVGPDATDFLERLYPCHVKTIGEGKNRYAVLLNEAGYLFDDGLICNEGEHGYYLTLTSGGADQGESWLRDWADTWKLRVHVVNLTATLGAINVAGPKARDLLPGSRSTR
jgi:sarcosine oxidase subunit alpha